jgi:hypothetical protein
MLGKNGEVYAIICGRGHAVDAEALVRRGSVEGGLSAELGNQQPPNNSLMLTRRVEPSLVLVLPGGLV